MPASAVFQRSYNRLTSIAVADSNIPECKCMNICHEGQTFIFVPEQNVYGLQNGMAMVCPAHKHGTPAEAMEKLKGILKNWSVDKGPVIWVCRANQVETLKMFAPLAKQIIVNPFVHGGHFDSRQATTIWAGMDHPCLNHMRDLIRASNGTPLLACIDVNGEPNHFKKRKASFEEIEWMTFAAIGTGFKGIVWRGSLPSLPWQAKLKRLECAFSQYADEIAKATPFSLVKASAGQPYSVLLSDNKMFVILLNPDYCTNWDSETVILPIELQPCQGSIEIMVPSGKKIVSCSNIMKMLPTIHNEQEKVFLDYSFPGGGMCYIIELEPVKDHQAKQGVNESQ